MANFDASIEDLSGQGPLTIENVTQALKDIAQSIFPHRALERQKLWMKRTMVKPYKLSTKRFFSAVTRVNNDLTRFPGANENLKFSDAELLELLECSLPRA